jgi:hypothetical protein
MSLQTDIVFVKALQGNAELMAKLPAGNVYNTSIALPDEDIDNAPPPYIIVSFDGLTNDQSTKDGYEGDTDVVNISIEIAAKTRKQLGELAEDVRCTVREFFESVDEEDELYDLVPYDYQFTAQGVMYDSMKPCYWQVLNWQCDTNP